MSIFTMEQVNIVFAMSIKDARVYVEGVITADITAKPATKAKARNQILTKNSPASMAYAMSNWILAHPTEGLKVI